MQATVDLLQITQPETVNTNESMLISVIVVFISIADQVSFANSVNVDLYAGGDGLL